MNGSFFLIGLRCGYGRESVNCFDTRARTTVRRAFAIAESPTLRSALGFQPRNGRAGTRRRADPSAVSNEIAVEASTAPGIGVQPLQIEVREVMSGLP